MNVIKQLARKNGTTTNEISKEISFAIQQCFNNPDPQIQATLKRLFLDEKQPSPEKFIKVLSYEIIRKDVLGVM